MVRLAQPAFFLLSLAAAGVSAKQTTPTTAATTATTPSTASAATTTTATSPSTATTTAPSATTTSLAGRKRLQRRQIQVSAQPPSISAPSVSLPTAASITNPLPKTIGVVARQQQQPAVPNPPPQQQPPQQPQPQPQSQGLNATTIRSLISSPQAQFQIFSSILSKIGFSNFLDDTNNQYTLFAPVDAAFASIPAPVARAIMSSPDMVNSILLYHIHRGGDVPFPQSLVTNLQSGGSSGSQGSQQQTPPSQQQTPPGQQQQLTPPSGQQQSQPPQQQTPSGQQQQSPQGQQQALPPMQQSPQGQQQQSKPPGQQQQQTPPTGQTEQTRPPTQQTSQRQQQPQPQSPPQGQPQPPSTSQNIFRLDTLVDGIDAVVDLAPQQSTTPGSSSARSQQQLSQQEITQLTGLPLTQPSGGTTPLVNRKAKILGVVKVGNGFVVVLDRVLAPFSGCIGYDACKDIPVVTTPVQLTPVQPGQIQQQTQQMQPGQMSQQGQQMQPPKSQQFSSPQQMGQSVTGESQT